MPTVLFRARVNDGGARVGELGELDAVLLAEEHLVVVAVADLEDLDGLVALGGHEQLARVVVVEAEDVPRRAAIPRVVAPEKL